MDFEEVKKTVFSRKPPSVKTKKEHYALFEKGFFGNKARTWESYDEIKKSGYKGAVSIRTREKLGWKTKYQIPLIKIPEVLKELKQKKISEDQVIYNEYPPDDRLLFQGEIMRKEKGLYFYYTTIKKPMKKALLEQQKTITGIKALLMLKQNLTPSSYDDLMELLELFPDDIIEFSTYEICFGDLPFRNTIIWEVRGY
jgi:hypothetical protein